MSQPQSNIPPANTPPVIQHATELISALCDGRITQEQFRELDSLISGDERVARLYVTLMHLDAAMYHFASCFADPVPRAVDIDVLDAQLPESGQALTLHETMMVPAVLEPCQVDHAEGEEVFQPKSVLFERSQAARATRIPPATIRAGIAAMLIIGLGYFIYALASRAPRTDVARTVPPAPHAGAPPIPVATIECSVKSVWETGFSPPPDGNFVAGQILGLKSGDVQLCFRRGGRLVIEGPAELEFESEAKVSLHRGRLVATVPGGGLVVDCPLGTVTDLGTQFGVAVRSDGSADVAVFEGQVSAALSATAATTRVHDMLLKVGQAAVISHEALSLRPEGAVPQQFVCHLVNGEVKSIDVTDLVSGGDGTTRRRGVGINASTGDIGALPVIETVVSDGKYHSVKGFPVIDGVFVPDGNRGEMIVDSAGHRFEFLEAGNSAYNNIYTGGRIPWPNAPELSTTFDGVDYASPDHAIICIHPNNALTLDLDAIRRLYPDRTLTDFHCRVCNAASGHPVPAGTKVPVAKLYALIDGVAKYNNQHFAATDGAVTIDVPISRQNRFLTLASTDTRNGHQRNWMLWTDAKLGLSTAN